MNRRTATLSVVLPASAGLLIAAAWRVGAQSGGPPWQTTLILGQPLPGLSDSEKDRFAAGLAAFAKTETRDEGLGVVFNGTSCGECHRAGAVGGAALDVQTARATRIGGIVRNGYSDLPQLGGPVLQARSLREFDTSCPVLPEVVPPQAAFVSHRITTPLFGAGLIEAIPDSEILAQSNPCDPDGVRGVPNIVYNPETKRSEVGRFGWKAQHSSLHLFAGDAYLNEMGITSANFPDESLPQGRPIPPGWAATAHPEDEDGDVEKFTDFMRLLAPPGRRLPITPLAQQGARIFEAIRCTACHAPELHTGPNAVAALANQPVRLYSDLLLHRMGPALADGIRQGQAQGDQFRTAPLWGLSRRPFLLHDGRAGNPADAIALHGGESAPARSRFLRLGQADRAALLTFLSTL